MRKPSMEMRWGNLFKLSSISAISLGNLPPLQFNFSRQKSGCPEKSLVKLKLWCYFSRKGVASKSFSRLPSQLCHYIWRLLDMVANFTFRDNLSATHVPDTLVELWLYMWPSFNSATPKSCVALIEQLQIGHDKCHNSSEMIRISFIYSPQVHNNQTY